jgi:hypothetical protein
MAQSLEIAAGLKRTRRSAETTGNDGPVVPVDRGTMNDARHQGAGTGDYDYFAAPPAPDDAPVAARTPGLDEASAPPADASATVAQAAPAPRSRWVAGGTVIALAVLVVAVATAARSWMGSEPDPEQLRADTRLAMPSSIGDWSLTRVDLDAVDAASAPSTRPEAERPLLGNYTTVDGRAAAAISATKFTGGSSIDETAIVEEFGFVTNSDDGLAPQFIEVDAGRLGGEARCVVPGPDQTEQSWTTCWFVNQAALVEVVVTDPAFDLDGVTRVRDAVQSVA